MPRLDGGEMAHVQGNHHVGAQPFCECSHRGIGASEREITVLLHEVGDARPILEGRSFDIETGEAAEKRGLGARSQAATHQIGDLGDDERRDDKVEVRPLENSE